jgi:hypothetical protein
MKRNRYADLRVVAIGGVVYIGEFKDGAFIIAVTAQVPVVPVAIHGTGRIWPPDRCAWWPQARCRPAA